LDRLSDVFQIGDERSVETARIAALERLVSNRPWSCGYGHRPRLGWGAGIYLGSPYYDDSPYYNSVPGYEPLPVEPYTAPAAAQSATLTILVPAPNAEVFLSGVSMDSAGEQRTFQSPPLEVGADYQYVVKARWMEGGQMVEQTRDVPVQAGQQVTVDFREPAR
jgi:uncharacterized protein (TIGR03000 family)